MSKQPNNQPGMTIDQVLGESFETYLTLEDAKLLHGTFKNNPRLLRVLKKVFIPTIQDPDMPAEQMASDFWMSGKQWDNIPVDEIKALVVGRQEALQFILGGIMRIKAIANTKEEGLQEMHRRRAEDSNK